LLHAQELRARAQAGAATEGAGLQARILGHASQR
jgi:hypothetical protein